MAVVCPAHRLDIVVTDPEAPAEEVGSLRHAGVEVLGVDPEDTHELSTTGGST